MFPLSAIVLCFIEWRGCFIWSSEPEPPGGVHCLEGETLIGEGTLFGRGFTNLLKRPPPQTYNSPSHYRTLDPKVKEKILTRIIQLGFRFEMYPHKSLPSPLPMIGLQPPPLQMIGPMGAGGLEVIDPCL